MSDNKVLTVSVAAYNVERYLERCLSSMVIEEVMEKLEVFVIDDGGTDGSLNIAEFYQDKYPGVFHAVHKENGGYGSTINWSIAHASGKYYKTMDGDDWFDREGLCSLVKLLEETDVDVVTSGYYWCTEKGREFREYVGVKDNDFDGIPRVISIWQLTFKTDMLKKSGMTLPEHVLYTDQLYTCVPFEYVSTGTDFHKGVYCYYFGRNEQSCTVISRANHIKDAEYICNEVLDFFNGYEGHNREYIKKRAVQCACFNLRNILLRKTSNESMKMFMKRDLQIRSRSQEIYDGVGKKGKLGKYISICRRTGYRVYYLKGLFNKRF